MVGMTRLKYFGDPVRDAMVYAESASGEFPSWPLPVLLRRLRIRYGLKRFELAAKAGVSPSLVGRAEKGADVRVSTLVKLFGAVGCRPMILPAGGSYDLDWKQAHLDNDYIDWKKKAAAYLRPRPEEPMEK